MVGRGHPLVLAAALVVSAASVWAQSTAAARVVEMQGRVSVFQDNNEIPLYAGSPVQPRQLIRTGPDGYAKFQLADGSTFEVFQNSQAVFRTNPASLGDLLDVVIGRVKVFIQHRNGPNPNRVTTQTAVISVRGTVFDVVVEDEDATTLVSVDEGIVGVRHLLLPGNEIQLQTGESFRVFRNQPLAKRLDRGGAAKGSPRCGASRLRHYVDASGRGRVIGSWNDNRRRQLWRRRFGRSESAQSATCSSSACGRTATRDGSAATSTGALTPEGALRRMLD